MESKNRKSWKMNRSVVKKPSGRGKSRSCGGQVVYKGTAIKVEVDDEGNQKEVKRDKFLVRIGKIAAETVVGTPTEAKEKVYELLGKYAEGTLGNGSTVLSSPIFKTPIFRVEGLKGLPRRPSKSTGTTSKTTLFPHWELSLSNKSHANACKRSLTCSVARRVWTRRRSRILRCREGSIA